MSTSRELVAELLGMGQSRRSIGRAIGRNDRLIGYVETGAKPGKDLAESLQALKDQLGGAAVSVPEPPRRQTAGNRVARVRQARTVDRGSWTNTKLGKQAARNTGGESLRPQLGKAADAGATVAVTVTFRPGVPVNGSSGRRGRVNGSHDVTMKLDPEEIGEGNPLDNILAAMADAGYVSGEVDRGDVAAVELRTYGG